MFPLPNIEEKSRIVSEAMNEFVAKTGAKNCLIVLSYDEPLALNADGGLTAKKPVEVHPFGMVIKAEGPSAHVSMLSFLAHSTIHKFPHIYAKHMEDLNEILAKESPIIFNSLNQPSES